MSDLYGKNNRVAIALHRPGAVSPLLCIYVQHAGERAAEGRYGQQVLRHDVRFVRQAKDRQCYELHSEHSESLEQAHELCKDSDSHYERKYAYHPDVVRPCDPGLCVIGVIRIVRSWNDVESSLNVPASCERVI